MAKKFSYDGAIEEIETIITDIENSEIEVDELLDKVKKASGLIKKCKVKLLKSEEEVNNIFDEKEEE